MGINVGHCKGQMVTMHIEEKALVARKHCLESDATLFWDTSRLSVQCYLILLKSALSTTHL